MQTAQQAQTNTADTSSESVISDRETSDDAVVEKAAMIVASENTTEKVKINIPMTESTANVLTQKNAQPSVTEKDMQEKQSSLLEEKETTSKSTQTDAEKLVPTAVPPAETTTKPIPTTTEPQKEFDINYWIEFAKGYAKSVGLRLESSAVDCWDNPIPANVKCKYLERDIKSRLNLYAKDEDITDVWIWAEKVSDNSYEIYIGYA